MAGLVFTFDGRQDTYNDFHWHWYHFTGTDYDAKRRKSGIYLIQGDNKGWANEELVDNENGNYDYLMYADLDFKHPEVIQNIYEWADWFMETTGVAGFRLDAIKHIDSFFMSNFIRDMKEKYGEDFYVFGDSGILTRKPIWTILKKRKNALTLSMFVSTRISLKPVKLAQTMTFVVFSQIAWLNSNLTRL